MAKIVKLSSLRIGETFILLPPEVKSFFGEGVTIYNFTPPILYYIFSSFDRWTLSCCVYSSTSACLPFYLDSDTLVLKF